MSTTSHLVVDDTIHIIHHKQWYTMISHLVVDDAIVQWYTMTL